METTAIGGRHNVKKCGKKFAGLEKRLYVCDIKMISKKTINELKFLKR